MGIYEKLESKYIINTYNRQKGSTPCLVRGEGSYAWDDQGKKYLDFLSGLAVNAVGHCHPAVVEAISRQAARLIHTSNLYYGAPQSELAEALVKKTMEGGKVFFANSGAEVNEAAIKLARKNKDGRFKIITALQSFHGRTMATITATGQPKYQEPFKPLLDGFSYANFNDLESFEALVDEHTAAIMIEPIQGEGGVHVAEKGFIEGLRDICSREKILLIFDEVQCGMGRTGKLWAFENWKVVPDIVTVAKGLGGGLPIGAMIAAEPYTEILQPGDHASTFGGNPVVCSASLAVLEIILGDGFLEEVENKGKVIREKFVSFTTSYPECAGSYRGLGLICALELKKPLAKKIHELCTAEGLLINAIGDTTIRLLPPLTISEEELQDGLNVLESVIKALLK